MAAAAPKARNQSWNTGDDTKLLGLFEEKKVEADIEQTKDNIEAIRAKHFSHIPYRNFRTLFLKKSAQYTLDGTLKGANKPGE